MTWEYLNFYHQDAKNSLLEILTGVCGVSLENLEILQDPDESAVLK